MKKDSKMLRSNEISLMLLILGGLLLASSKLAGSTQLSVGIDHDMSKATYGLQQPTSSQMTYDDRNGLNMKGTINDLLGPPIKIANGFNNMIIGGNMAGIGGGLRTGGALLGFDAKLLEAAGDAKLLKGGLLMGSALGKTGAATALKGIKGKKIASIIELPVKVVAMKDLVAGKALTGMGRAKGTEASAAKNRGTALIERGDALKQQGINQVVQGATEGIQNLGNMVQQTAGNAATAFRFLPIILDAPMANQQQQEQHEDATKTSHQQQQQLSDYPHQSSLPHQMHQSNAGSLTGGSLFGGLSSLLPGLAAGDPFSGMTGNNAGQLRSPFAGLMANQNGLFGNQNGYAAMLNSTSPLTNLLMNPGLNPFLLPMSSGSLSQSPISNQPFGGAFNLLSPNQPARHNFNLFPGLRISETSSSNQPAAANLVQETKVGDIQQQQQIAAPAIN